MKQRRRPGRPRSESAQRAILEATGRLLEETAVRNITIEGVAKAAGVGKPTIYRWWDGKCSLVMEAFLASTAPAVAFPGAASTVRSLELHVRRTIRWLRGRPGRIVAEMVGEGQSDPAVLEKFRKLFFAKLLAPAREALVSGKQQGELPKDLDEDLALDLIYGPVYYRLLVGHEQLDERFADTLARNVRSVLRPGPR